MLSLDPVDTLFAEHLLRPFPEALEESKLFLAFLLHMSREGHLCLFLDEKKILPQCETSVHMQLLKGAQALPSPLLETTIVHLGNRWYLRRYFESESLVAKHLLRIKEAKVEYEGPISFLENLTIEQKNAIEHAFHFPLTLISGGPGTGKSLTAKELLRLFRNIFPQKKVAAAAPTGKAAAHLREGLQEEITICTLHALLAQGIHFFDLILIDEASMMDSALMARLFSSLKMGSRLVLIGDRDQLPPVEAGSLFATLVTLEEKNTLFLKCSFRHENNEIIEMAERVKNGLLPSFKLLPSPQEVVEWVKEMNVECLSTFRVLTPLRKGPYGVENLNSLFFDSRASDLDKIPILITANDATLGLANGDLGFLLPKEKKAIFRNCPQPISEALLPSFELAYFLSIHKSQGSEYEEVRILIPEGSERFGRELLYTAITRAKKRVTLYAANQEVVRSIVSKETRRLTGLIVD